MKKLLATTTALALGAGAAWAQDSEVKIGIILGFTGPIESLTPHMAAGAELAMSEVSESGKLLDGMTVSPVRADSTCIDAGAATAAAERLITSEGVKGIMGADCSGVTGAILSNAAVASTDRRTVCLYWTRPSWMCWLSRTQCSSTPRAVR